MNKLLKSFIATIGAATFALWVASCSEEEVVKEEDLEIAGKVFVDSYSVNSDEEHSSSIEAYEFTNKGTFSNRSWFCYFAGEYITLFDNEETGMYTIKDNNISLAYPTYVKTGKVQKFGDKLYLKIDDGYEFSETEKTIMTLSDEFRRAHEHKHILDVVKNAATSITVSVAQKFIVENNRKSFLVNIDSISGSLAEKNQLVHFSINNVPGNFKLSDAERYLVRIGPGFATTDESYALEAPQDILLVLSDVKEFTLVSATSIEAFKAKAKPTIIAPLATKQ